MMIAKPLALFAIGLFLGGGTGFMLATGGTESSHDHMGHIDADHAEHDKITAWPDDMALPQLSVMATADMEGDVNLHIIAEDFRFAPQEVNGPVTPGSGHAHVYVDGEKAARAYSPFVYLMDVPEGAIIRVTLNANDHTVWGVEDQPIAAETTAP